MRRRACARLTGAVGAGRLAATSEGRTSAFVSRPKGTLIARIDDLMDRVDSKFHLVHLSAKRAREINGYFAHLGEGIGNFVPPLLSTDTNKPLSIALEEIATGKIEGREPTDTEEVADPLAFIADDDTDGGDEAS